MAASPATSWKCLSDFLRRGNAAEGALPKGKDPESPHMRQPESQL